MQLITSNVTLQLLMKSTLQNRKEQSQGIPTCSSVQDVCSACIALLHVLHMLLEALRAPVVQQGCNHHLGEGTWTQSAAMQMEDELL